MDGHIDINVNVSRRCEDRILLQFDRLKLTDDAADLRLDVAGNGLEVHRLTWRAAHHRHHRTLGWSPIWRWYGTPCGVKSPTASSIAHTSGRRQGGQGVCCTLVGRCSLSLAG